MDNTKTKLIDHPPHVFISYSWASEEYKQEVINLATRLKHDGIEVTLDVWHLKEGDDKYNFMERCVNDPDINKVLILCDKTYAKKADDRKGGVGDETAIITPQVYGKVIQSKFIPVVMERDGAGEPYLPAYLKSRMYKDYTSRDEKSYRALVRSIYEVPEEQEPELGTAPDWLTEEKADDLFSVTTAELKVRSASVGGLKDIASSEFIDAYIDSLKRFYRPYKAETSYYEQYLKDFNDLLEYRNIFLDYVKSISANPDFGSMMADNFEYLYNKLTNVQTYEQNQTSAYYEAFDIFKFHIWELFVCTTEFMLKYKKYKDIHDLLVHTYFLSNSPLSAAIKPYNYAELRAYSRLLEEEIKHWLPDEDLKRKFTLQGHLAITNREYGRDYTSHGFANADLFLYQIFNVLDLNVNLEPPYWFPECYVYTDQYNSNWKKLVSKSFCEKLYPLLGVDNLDDFKERISKCKPDREIRYTGCFETASSILDWVKLEDIGMYP